MVYEVLGNIPADSWPKLAFAEELGEDLRARVAPYGAALRVCGAVVSESVIALAVIMSVSRYRTQVNFGEIYFGC